LTKYVIGPDVALRLANDAAVIPDEHQILAPTLLRSQLLSLLYQAVRSINHAISVSRRIELSCRDAVVLMSGCR
jgi:hypothetical protein